MAYLITYAGTSKYTILHIGKLLNVKGSDLQVE